MRRAKIVATLGPATSTYETVRAIIDAGVDVARMNLSHGDYAVHETNYANVRKAADDAGRAVAVLVDLQGPKIRLGKFAAGPHFLEVGDIFKITIEDIPGTALHVGLDWRWESFREYLDAIDRRPYDIDVAAQNWVLCHATTIENPQIDRYKALGFAHTTSMAFGCGYVAANR